MVEVLVWLGTLIFAATGALKGVEKGFDLLGVLVLATVTAVGGGSIRDVLVGTLPPTALHNEPSCGAWSSRGFSSSASTPGYKPWSGSSTTWIPLA